MKYTVTSAKALLLCAGIVLLYLNFPMPDTTMPGTPASAPWATRQGEPSGTNINKSDPSGSSSGQTAKTTPASTPGAPAYEQLSTAGTISKQTVKTVVVNDREYPLRTYKTLLTPNDPQASQWWVNNAKLPEAWDTPRGSQSTALAIIDTGFALQHEEFNGRWHTNSGETGTTSSQGPSSLNCADRGLALSASCNLIDDNSDSVIDNETGPATSQNPSRRNCTDQLIALTKNCNRLDDDGNGYIDDVTGWDFINGDNSPQAGELNPMGTGTTHGTQVAGVAAATGNNAKGIAGVDWGTKILPLQALDDDSYGHTLSVGQAIRYATSRQVDVISLSLGSDLPDSYVRESIQQAVAAGIVVVAASGNDGCDCVSYPANYPEVLAVGALNSSSQPASFSSWGQNLDILAPGTSITSSSYSSSNPASAYASGLNGTSFAAPMISGMLTRLVSHQPAATPLQLVAALTENTNRMALPANVPHSSQVGYGSVHFTKATARLVTARNAAQLYALKPVSKGDKLYPGQPSEQLGSYQIYDCQDSQMGTTPLFELTRASTRYFTISPAEAAKAEANGYLSTRFGYGCLQQPHDTAQTTRVINMFHEFKNTSEKL